MVQCKYTYLFVKFSSLEDTDNCILLWLCFRHDCFYLMDGDYLYCRWPDVAGDKEVIRSTNLTAGTCLVLDADVGFLSVLPDLHLS